MVNEPTTALTLEAPPEVRDVLVAALAEAGFDGFTEEGDRLAAFVPKGAWTERLRSGVLDRVRAHGASIVSERTIEPENWNALWEASVTPVEAGPFVVHPPWTTPGQGRIAIGIEPKMSFGTGHHETTRLMLGAIARHVRKGMSVLDAGTGTGVLAIAALRIGASFAEAFDVEPWAVENAVENAGRNGVADRMTVRQGGLDAAPAGPFDAVLANINRNVLLDMLPGLRARLAADGVIALAGVLLQDREVMLGALESVGLALLEEETEGDWLALVARRI